METLLEVIKYTLPALLVLATTYLIINNYFKNKIGLKQLELQLDKRKASLPLQLQAYERLTLYLERISPVSLITRLRETGDSALGLQLSMVSSVRQEYNHNITQQLYITPETWILIKGVTEETISIINRTAAELPSEATGNDLSRKILQNMMTIEGILPTQDALESLKREAQNLL